MKDRVSTVPVQVIVPYFGKKDDGGDFFTEEQRAAARRTGRPCWDFEPDGQEKVQGVGVG